MTTILPAGDSEPRRERPSVRLGIRLPQSPRWSTLNGLLTAELGTIARPGAKHAFADGTVLEVLDATPRRVVRVRIVPPPAGDEVNAPSTSVADAA